MKRFLRALLIIAITLIAIPNIGLAIHPGQTGKARLVDGTPCTLVSGPYQVSDPGGCNAVIKFTNCISAPGGGCICDAEVLAVGGGCDTETPLGGPWQSN